MEVNSKSKMKPIDYNTATFNCILCPVQLKRCCMNPKDYFASENCREEIDKLSAERMRRLMESILARHYLACSTKTKSVNEHRFLKFIKNLLSCKDKQQYNTMKYQKKYK